MAVRKTGVIGTDMGQVIRRTDGVVIPRIDLNKYQVQVGTDERTKKAIFYTPLDIAREALDLQSALATVRQLETGFSTHMIQLAGMCKDADEFDVMCENVSLEMNWGKLNPAPQKWIVYRSTIYRAWKDQGIKPGAEIETPILKAGQLLIDSDSGEVKRENVVVTGINQIKRISMALKREEAGPPFAEKRSALRRLVERWTRPATEMDREASLLVQKLVWIYTHLDENQQSRFVQRLRKLAADFPVGEDFPDEAHLEAQSPKGTTH